MFVNVPKFKLSKGMAFFVTLAVLIALLSVVATFHARSYLAFTSFVTSKDTTQLRHIGASGINLGMAILILDKTANTQDSLLDAWADKDALWAMSQLLNFDEGVCVISITDLSGRIPVNALAEQGAGDNHEAIAEILERLIAENLTDLITDPNMTPRRIVTNIKQYIENRPHTEFNYINDPRELLQVDGITPLLLFGERNLDRDFNSADHWQAANTVVYDDTFGRLAGLAQFINVFGMYDDHERLYFDGRININTAPREVLFTLFPAADAPLINNIHRKIQATLAGTANENIDFHREEWFKEETGLLGHPDYMYNTDVITTQSDWYEICAAAVAHNGMEKRIKVVVKREFTPSGRLECKIYSWEESDTMPVSKELAALLRQSGASGRPRTTPFSEIRQN